MNYRDTNVVGQRNGWIRVWWYGDGLDYTCRCGQIVKNINFDMHMKTCFAYKREEKISVFICGKCGGKFIEKTCIQEHFLTCTTKRKGTEVELSKAKRHQLLLTTDNVASTSNSNRILVAEHGSNDQDKAVVQYFGKELGFTCKCGYKTKAGSLEEHLALCQLFSDISHKRIDIRCGKCNRDCVTKYEASIHFEGCSELGRNPKDIGKHSCEDCTMSFGTSRGLKIHRRARHRMSLADPSCIKPRWNDAEINLIADTEVRLRLSQELSQESVGSRELSQQIAKSAVVCKGFTRTLSATTTKVLELTKREDYLLSVRNKLFALYDRNDNEIHPEMYATSQSTDSSSQDSTASNDECGECLSNLTQAVTSHLANLTDYENGPRLKFLVGVLNDLDSYDSKELMKCSIAEPKPKKEKIKRKRKRRLNNKNHRAKGVRNEQKRRLVGRERAMIDLHGPKTCSTILA